MSLFKKNRVLFPFDFTELNSIAFDKTLEFVEEPANLYVVHVLTPLSSLDPGIVWEQINNETRQKNVEKKFWDTFNSPKYQGINFEVLFGKTSSKIVEYAQEKEIELIILLAQGNEGFNPLLIGTVTERVVRLAHCPVYVFRLNKGD